MTRIDFNPLITAVALCAVVPVRGAAGQGRLTPALPTVAELARSVVTIEVDRLDGSATGSGVILDPNGLIATAAHVIAGSTAGRARLTSGQVFKIEGVVDVDPQLDVALVRVAGFQMPTAILGNSDSVQLGQRLLAIGSPIGLAATVTDGLLSALRNDEGRVLLQISIPVSHGSSGGPIFTERGEVIGLVVSGFRADVAQNINFALPINYVRGKLALAGGKTPIPLAQAAITMPAAPTSIGQEPSSGAATEPTGNLALALDWTRLAGVEGSFEEKGDNGARQSEIVQYTLTTNPSGAPLLARHVQRRHRVKLGPLQTVDAAEDAVETEISIGLPYHLHERLERTSHVAGWQSGVVDVLIEERQYEYSVNGQTRTGSVPRGTVTQQLVNAAIAALPDSLPGTIFVAALDPNTGRADAIRVAFGSIDLVKVPLVAVGSTCGPDAITHDTTVAVRWVTISSGVRQITFPVLSGRPHLNVDPSTLKCLRRPGWGGSPRMDIPK